MLQHAAPETLLKELEDKVWQWIVSSVDMPVFKQKYVISSTVRRSDGIQIRVVSKTTPTAEAQSIAPSLEDAYLYLVSQQGAQP